MNGLSSILKSAQKSYSMLPIFTASFHPDFFVLTTRMHMCARPKNFCALVHMTKKIWAQILYI